MELLYFHGGPGFNSNPEQHLLTEPYKAAGFTLICWNEPSAQRDPDYDANGNGFAQYLDSAERFLLAHYQNKPLNLVAHSFGSHAAVYLCKKHPEKIKKVVFISSGFCVSCADKRLFRLTIADFKAANDSKAEELQKVLQQYSGKFDENAQNGMNLLLQNPTLFNHYWLNIERMVLFFSYYSGDQFALDINGFFAVRQSCYPIALQSSSIPVVAIYGKSDPVISTEVEKDVLKEYFSHTTFYEVESAHYPHLENMDRVLRLIKQSFLSNNFVPDTKGH